MSEDTRAVRGKEAIDHDATGLDLALTPLEEVGEILNPAISSLALGPTLPQRYSSATLRPR